MFQLPSRCNSEIRDRKLRKFFEKWNLYVGGDNLNIGFIYGVFQLVILTVPCSRQAQFAKKCGEFGIYRVVILHVRN